MASRIPEDGITISDGLGSDGVDRGVGKDRTEAVVDGFWHEGRKGRNDILGARHMSAAPGQGAKDGTGRIGKPLNAPRSIGSAVAKSPSDREGRRGRHLPH